MCKRAASSPSNRDGFDHANLACASRNPGRRRRLLHPLEVGTALGGPEVRRASFRTGAVDRVAACARSSASSRSTATRARCANGRSSSPAGSATGAPTGAACSPASGRSWRTSGWPSSTSSTAPSRSTTRPARWPWRSTARSTTTRRSRRAWPSPTPSRPAPTARSSWRSTSSAAPTFSTTCRASSPSPSTTSGRGRYLIARDPIGVMPLYTGYDEEGRFYVASEMKALVGICKSLGEFPPGHYLDSEVGEPLPYYKPAWGDYEAVAGNAARPGAAARGARGRGRAAADERRALRRAAVGRSRLVADQRPGAPPQRAPDRGRRAQRGLVAAAALLRHRPRGLARPRGGTHRRRAHRHRPPRASSSPSRRGSTRSPT